LKLSIYFSFPDSYRGQRKVTKKGHHEKALPTLLAAQPRIPGSAALFVDVHPQIQIKVKKQEPNSR
jgi:hypothetical protein